jgi:hypothetical protein
VASFASYIDEGFIFNLFLQIREPTKRGIEVACYNSGGMGFGIDVAEDVAENAICSPSRLVIGFTLGVSIYDIDANKAVGPYLNGIMSDPPFID